jgi:hypothetical protein
MIDFYFQLTPRAVVGFVCLVILVFQLVILPKWLGE